MMDSRVSKIDTIQEILNGICPDDKSQMTVMSSNVFRMFVTAPAGYGKTATMTGKIVYELASGIVAYPKRVLALTFSVSAARKMRSQANEALANAKEKLGTTLSDGVFVSNYHGFARRLLELYGGLVKLDPGRLRELKMCDEGALLSSLSSANIRIPSEASHALSSLTEFVRRGDRNSMVANLTAYNDVVSKYAINNGLLTYNGLITLAIELMQNCPELAAYLRKVFPSVMVDEAQDTNVLHLEFISHVIGAETRCCFFGDPLQRVYSFLGALADFRSIAVREFDLKECALENNHRFEKGSELFRLDKCLRAFMGGRPGERGLAQAELPVSVAKTFDGQVMKVSTFVSTIMENHGESTIAVLFNKRSTLSSRVCSTLESHGIEYFDALFSDDSDEYTSMCDTCLDLLNSNLSNRATLSSAEAKDALLLLSRRVAECGYEYSKSYADLLRALAGRVGIECSGMDGSDRYHYVASILATHSLRRYSEFVKARLTISTIHSAKGLEWDYVLVPGVTKWDFPVGTCGSCPMKDSQGVQRLGIQTCCLGKAPLSTKMREQLNIWYVALTRARKQVVAISSLERITGNGNFQSLPTSCFLELPDIASRPVTEKQI